MNLCTAIIILARTKRFGRSKVAKVSSYHADVICKPQGRSFCIGVGDHVTYVRFRYVTFIFTSLSVSRACTGQLFFFSISFGGMCIVMFLSICDYTHCAWCRLVIRTDTVQIWNVSFGTYLCTYNTHEEYKDCTNQSLVQVSNSTRTSAATEHQSQSFPSTACYSGVKL